MCADLGLVCVVQLGQLCPIKSHELVTVAPHFGSLAVVQVAVGGDQLHVCLELFKPTVLPALTHTNNTQLAFWLVVIFTLFIYNSFTLARQ